MELSGIREELRQAGLFDALASDVKFAVAFNSGALIVEVVLYFQWNVPLVSGSGFPVGFNEAPDRFQLVVHVVERLDEPVACTYFVVIF